MEGLSGCAVTSVSSILGMKPVARRGAAWSSAAKQLVKAWQCEAFLIQVQGSIIYSYVAWIYTEHRAVQARVPWMEVGRGTTYE